MVELIDIEDERLKSVLSYPKFDDTIYSRNVKALKEIGIEALMSEGKVNLGKIKVVGKGCVGIVILGVLRGEKVAIKVLRSDSNRDSLVREGEILKIVNESGIGPKLISAKDSVIVMEYVQGVCLPDWLRTEKDFKRLVKVLKDILNQCHKLDLLGVDHGELSNPKEHIIIEGDRAVIVDFETASLNRKCRNLSSVMGYLFFNKENAKILRNFINWNDERLSSLVRKYKSSPAIYEEILEEIEWKV